MFVWDCEVDAWSIFWRSYFGKLSSTLGSVVPLPMFSSNRREEGEGKTRIGNFMEISWKFHRVFHAKEWLIVWILKKTLGGWKGTNLTKFQKMVKVLIADFGLGQNKTDSFAIALQPLYRIFISFSAQNKQHLNCMKSSFATLQFINQLKKLNVTSEHHSETILISILIDRGNHERI